MAKITAAIKRGHWKEYFNYKWLNNWLQESSRQACLPEGVQATLLVLLTARSISHGISQQKYMYVERELIILFCSKF